MALAAAHPGKPTMNGRAFSDVDPATLLIDLNVWHDTRLDAEFCASIIKHGVQQVPGVCRPGVFARPLVLSSRDLATVPRSLAACETPLRPLAPPSCQLGLTPRRRPTTERRNAETVGFIHGRTRPKFVLSY